MGALADTIFADPTLEDDFRRDGYVVVPFLDQHEVDHLTRLHHEVLPEIPSDFFSTAFMPDNPERRQLVDGINSVVEPHLRRLMPAYHTAFSGFVVKRGQTTQGKLPLHQDYTFVDQDAHVAVHLWCPLLDVDEQNGCLKVVAGSHAIVNHISAMVGNPSPYDAVRSIVETDCTTSVPMAAGHAMLLDERLLHGSENNIKPGVRLAVAAAFLPHGVKQRLYVAEPDAPERLQVLELEDQYAVQLLPGVPLPTPYPEGINHIATIDYRAQQLTQAQIEPLRVRQTLAEPSLSDTPMQPPQEEPSQEQQLAQPIKKLGFFARLFGR